MTSGKQRISVNFAVLSAGQLASRLLAFATTVHLAHVLLPEYFGLIVYGTSVLLYAGILVDFGFDGFGPIEVSRGTSDLHTLASNVITWRSLMALPALVALSIFAVLIPVSALCKLIIVLYGLSLLVNPFDLSWIFMGTRKMWPAALADVILQLLSVVGALVFVHGPSDVVRMPFVFLVARLMSVGFLFMTFSKEYGRPLFTISWPYFKRLLGGAVPLAGSQLMSMISNNFDIVMIGILLSSTGTGLYGAAYRIVWMPTTIAIAYYAALRPSLAHSYIDGFDTIEPLFKRSVRITTALAIGVGTGGCIVASELLAQLYGSGYVSAVRAFQILLGSFCFLLVSRNYRLLLVSFNHQVTDLKIMSTAAILNITLNLALIHPFGISGAAAATLASEGLILVCTYTLTHRLVSHVPLGRYLLRPIICSCIMAILLLSLPASLHVFLKIALGGLSYLVLLLLSGVVTAEELRNVRSSLANRQSGRNNNRPGAKPAPVLVQHHNCTAERQKTELCNNHRLPATPPGTGE